jgi:hypothetical protein
MCSSVIECFKRSKLIPLLTVAAATAVLLFMLLVIAGSCMVGLASGEQDLRL